MISIKSIVHDDRAVSETLGYILLFGIALTAIAIILLVGNSIINNEKSKDNFQNMVQSFNIIQSNMKQVALDGTPVKTTVIHMDGGSFGINTDTARLKVDVDGTLFYNHTTGHIMFTKEEDIMDNVSIENGGVWKTTDGYSSIVSQPRIYITPETDTMVLNVYRLYSTSPNVANAGTGTMTIEMSYNDNSNVLPTQDVTGDVILTIDTHYPQAWTQYLDDLETGTGGAVTVICVDTPDGIVATISGVKKLIISEHWIDLTLSGIYT